MRLYGLLLLIASTAFGGHTIHPKNAEVAIYGSVYFVCQPFTATGYVTWKHCPLDIEDCREINSGHLVYEDYQERFKLDASCMWGPCKLTIDNVQPDDAGEYCCYTQKNEMYCSNLSVVTGIDCTNDAGADGIVTGTSCNIPVETIQHTCSISLRGSHIPKVILMDFAGNEISQKNIKRHRVNGTLSRTLSEPPTGNIRKNGVICMIVGLPILTCSSQYEAHFAFNTSTMLTVKSGAVQCMANASGPCSYFWRRDEDPEFRKTGGILEFTNSSLKEGNYVCYAKCSIKSTSCVVTVMIIHYSQDGWEGTNVRKLGIVIASIILVVFSVLLVVCVIFWWSRKKGPNILKKIPRNNVPHHAISNDDRDESTSLLNVVVCEPIPIPAPQSDTIQRDVKVRGVVVINNLVYFVCKHYKYVAVYDMTNRLNLAHIPVEELMSPWGLVKCNTNRYLYVSEYDNAKEAHIFRIELKDDNNHIATRWPLSKEFRTSWVRVSVTPANHVLVCGWTASVLEIYDSEMRRLKVINMEWSIVHVQQAVMMSDNRILLIHGWKDDAHHRVCILDSQQEGQVVASYGTKKADLYTPTDVIQSRKGTIFIADYRNDRVLVLSATLVRQEEIYLKSKKWNRPCRLCLDEAETHLYVGEDNDDGLIIRLNISESLP